MPIESPSKPDIRRGVIAFLKGKADHLDKVDQSAGRAPRAPYTVIEHGGDIQQSDTRVMRARVYIHNFGNNPDEARRVAYQCMDAFLPPANVTWGVHATVSYEDEEGNTRTITLSGAQLESGPREAPESRSRVITSYLVDYY